MLLASLLVGSAGVDAIPLAIIGAVVGWLAAAVVDPPPAAQPQAQQRPAAEPPAQRGPAAEPQAKPGPARDRS